MVALDDTCAHSDLLRELERRLEEMDEQPRGPVEATEHLRCGDTFESAIADRTADDRPVLLLDPSLVVLPVGTRSRELDPVLAAEGDHFLVDEL
jgi:hypothetical protein